MSQAKDRSGQRSGNLFIIERDFSPRAKKQTHWKCRCDCGQECSVAAFRLNSGGLQTISCGCVRRDPNQWRRNYHNEYGLRWRKKNPERARDTRRKFNLNAKYGLSPEAYQEMWALQKGLCAICNLPLPQREERGGFPPVDHCHKSRKNRGIVHGKCNKGLGLFDDDPNLLRLAADYLEKHAQTNS